MFLILFKIMKKDFSAIKRKGFSLIEALLGLAIFSVIAVTLYSTFWSGIQIDQRSEDRIYRQASWALEGMARELQNATIYDFSSSYPDINWFLGEKERIRFLVTTDEGIKVVQYYLEKEEEIFIHKVIIGKRSRKSISVTERRQEALVQEVLIREEQDLVDFINKSKDRSLKEVVCFNVEEQGLKFSYAFLESSENDSQLAWKDVWENNYVPAGIRVELKIVDSQTRSPLVIRRSIYVPAGFWGEEVL